MSDTTSHAVPDSVTLHFDISSQIPGSTDAKVRAAVEQAVREAITAAEYEYEVEAKAEVEGAFLGVGETVVVLTILHLAKAGGIAFAKGAVQAAGAAFFTAYVAPRLRSLNILPSEPKDVTSAPATPALSPAPDSKPAIPVQGEAAPPATTEPGDGKEK
jgi:hypothetical protein